MDPSLLASTRQAWNITDEEIAAAAKRNKQVPDRKSSGEEKFDPAASSSAGVGSTRTGGKSSNGSSGASGVQLSQSAEISQRGNLQEPASTDDGHGPSEVLSSSTSSSAVAAAMDSSTVRAETPGDVAPTASAAAAAVPPAPPARTWSIAVVPAAHYDRKGVDPTKGGSVEQHDPMSWSTRTAAGGGRCGGYCFKLEHPTKRLDVWCRSAKEVNQWVGAFTGDAKIPMSLHSERLPPPELQDNDGDNDDDENDEAILRAKQRKKKEEEQLPRQAAWVTPEALAAAKANAEKEEAEDEVDVADDTADATTAAEVNTDAETAAVAETSEDPAASKEAPTMPMDTDKPPEIAPVAITHALMESKSSATSSADPNALEEEKAQNVETKPKRGPRGKFQSMFGPSAAATIVRRAPGNNSNNSSNSSNSSSINSSSTLQGAKSGSLKSGSSEKSQDPLAPFATNPSRQKVCCFCGERETPAVPPPPFRPPPPPPPPLGWGPFTNSPDKKPPSKTMATTGKDKGSKGLGKGAGKGKGSSSNKHHISPKKGAEVVDERAQAKVNFIAPAKSPRGTGKVADGEGALLHGPYFAGRRPTNEQGASKGAARSVEAMSASNNSGNNNGKGSGGRGSRAKAAAAAAAAALEAAGTKSATSAAAPAAAAEPLPPMKWGLKPREVFIACPYGLISDLACWPCLALNARSAHSEQQANVTVPFRAHGALFHTSDAVSGWTVAPPAPVACATAAAAAVAEATTQWGYRTALKVRDGRVFFQQCILFC